MAERKAVNKYYPPDWDPSKGSINEHNGSHPLRARARKINKGVLVVRFEMPFNIWCLGCNNHIAMGVRYNAEKSKVGNYYTTPIYQFKMKCHLCDNQFVIKTEPSKFDYTIEEGARRQVRPVISQGNDNDRDSTNVLQSSLQSAEEARRRISDSMFMLEKKVEDKLKSQDNQPNLRDLKKWRSRWEDSFSLNQLVRSQFRKSRKQLERAKEQDKILLKKASLKIPLAEPSFKDKIEAKKIIDMVMAEKEKDFEQKRKNDLLNANQFIAHSSMEIEKPIIQPSVQDRSKLRANVVHELINSERDFVQHLKDVVEGYLHRARKHPEIFTAQQIKTIFANIEQLYEFQRKFLEDLESCINWSDLGKSQVGKCFLRYEKGFSIYHHYCNNHPNATSELQDLFCKPIFRSFFEECRLKQNMIDISLDGFLLTPIQKICKYPLQLNELLKHTDNIHSDYADVSNALESMRNCANLANERKRRIEALADVMSFQEKIDNWFGPKLSETSSILVHSGEVSKMNSNTWSQGVQLYLFDHLLIYSKKDILKRNSLILKGKICMDAVTEISDADEYKPKKSFKLYCSEQKKWFVFTTKNENEKDEWIQAFERERNLVESDENEGFRITDKELGIARRTLQHRKRSRSARYKHHASKRPDTTIVDQLDLDDSNMMINRTLSLPSCIHPNHVMNFVEDSRVVSAPSNSSQRKKNHSPSPNSTSPMASSQQLNSSGGSGNIANVTNELPSVDYQPSGPGNWLRKMSSKKLIKSQTYQISNQQTSAVTVGLQVDTLSPTSSCAASIVKIPNHSHSATISTPLLDVDKTTIKYEELEKRHRDHMVSEQRARLHRLNNDLPPPQPLYPRSLTPTPFSGSNLSNSNTNESQQTNHSRPKSSPSHHQTAAVSVECQTMHSNNDQAISATEATSKSVAFNDRNKQPRRSRHEMNTKNPHPVNYSMNGHFQRSLTIRGSDGISNSEHTISLGQTANHGPTFETELVLSSGRIIKVREDAV